MKKAIYAFSGDPITYGHIDVIKRAAGVFDEVYVAIGMNPEKRNSYTFSLEERTEMAKRSLKAIPEAKVTSFTGMLTDFAYQQGIRTIVKAVRNSADVEYEKLLHSVGESQKLGIDTFVLFARNDLAHISSSVAKAVQKEQGDIHEYVPLYVKQRLEERILGQYVIGITGEIGAGKSYVAEKFVEHGQRSGIEVHNIDLDRIAHRILGDSKEPAHIMVKENIGKEFGIDPHNIDRKRLGEIVFSDEKKLNALNRIMQTPIFVETRREMYGKKGVLLINAPLLAEAGLSYMTNNNVILVEADEASRERRLERRENQMRLKEREDYQFNASEKKQVIEGRIKEDCTGRIWTVENSNGSDEKKMAGVFEQVIEDMQVKIR